MPQDIVGFTEMCNEVDPSVVMEFLNRLYSIFDQLVDIFGKSYRLGGQYRYLTCWVGSTGTHHM